MTIVPPLAYILAYIYKDETSRDEKERESCASCEDKELVPDEEVQKVYHSSLRACAVWDLTIHVSLLVATYRPRPTRCTNPYRSIPRHVSARLRSTPSSSRISAGVRPSGWSWSRATMRRRMSPLGSPPW